MGDKILLLRLHGVHRELTAELDRCLTAGSRWLYEPEKKGLMTAGERIYLLVLCMEDVETETVHKIYIGMGDILASGDGRSEKAACTIYHSSREPLFIGNFLDHTQFTFGKDGKNRIRASVEYSGKLIRLIQETMIRKNTAAMGIPARIQKQYPIRPEEGLLDEMAQHNEHCARIQGTHIAERERSEFQRDRERIVNSRAFRRLVDKAQIFTSSKGDHYRTRMTHTLEVAQIARSIANSLCMNIDLTEAIALGHDLGHTPFGHQGERTLAAILSGEKPLLPKVNSPENNPYGGFKHNFQSVRVASYLEEKYIDFPGLNLSLQTLEGMLKHTRIRVKSEGSSCSDTMCCDIGQFLPLGLTDMFFPEYNHSTTLEGQIVAIADEIAQRAHDMDDAFTSGLLDYAEFNEFIQMGAMKPLRDKIEDTYNSLETCTKRLQVDSRQMLWARIISDIIWYLVNDVVSSSRLSMQNFEKDELYYDSHRFSRNLIAFSGEGARICGMLEKLISKKAVNCNEVVRFDDNAEKIIYELFDRYYHNPRLMHIGTLRRLYIEMSQRIENTIDFIDGDPVRIRREMERIITFSQNRDRQEWSEKDEEYWLKNKLLVRCVADYISGMTDSFAMNEYRSL